MSGDQGTNKHPRLLSSEQWQHCLAEIDCDIPFNSFRCAFDSYWQRPDRGSGFYVICRAPTDSLHEAFLCRCHRHADDKLKAEGFKLGFRRRLFWTSSTPVKYLNGPLLDSFCDSSQPVKSLGAWLSGRAHGFCFYVNIDMDDWRPKYEAHLRELTTMIVNHIGSFHAPERTCLIFFAIQCCRNGARRSEAKDVEEIIADICPTENLERLDDFGMVRPNHVRNWFDCLATRKDFHEWLRGLRPDPLVDHVFNEGGNDLEERPLHTVFNRVTEFFSNPDNLNPRVPMFGPS